MQLIRLSFLIVFCAMLCGAAYLNAIEPSQVLTASDQALYESQRHGTMSVSANIDAGWDTVLVTISSTWASRTTIKNFLQSGYNLRSIAICAPVIPCSVAWFADGINCKYADIDSFFTCIGSGSTATIVEFTSVDSFDVWSATTGSTAYVYVRAYRPIATAP